MSLIAFGTNYKSAKLEVRERWSYGIDEIPDLLKSISNNLAISEVVLLSTCNRTEIYCDTENPDELINWFNKEIKPTAALDLETQGFIYHDQQAVTHLMRVAAGLDSMVVGEPQILGQFKQAFRLAKDAKTVGKKFDKLFDQVFAVAKTVRSNTDIGVHPVSVASASVNLLLDKLEDKLGVNSCSDLSNFNILLIGSGDTIRIIAQTLISKNIRNISLTSRTKVNAESLANKIDIAEIEIAVHDFDLIEQPELPENLAILSKFDVIFCATQSQNYILHYDTVKKIIDSNSSYNKQSKQLILIDLAVPRDIDPNCINLPHTCLYTIDDLDVILQHNTQLRHKSAQEAEKIIKKYANDFFAWERSLFVLSSICQYRQQADAMCAEVMEKAKRKLDAGQDPQEVLISALELLTNRLMHHPTVTLKSLAEQEKIAEVELLKDFLNL